MQHRRTRLAILCLLLAVGAVAGFFVWSAERRVQRLDEQREAKVTTIDRLLFSVSTISAAQQAYSEYGRRDVASLARVSVLVDRITTDAAGLRAAESALSTEHLEEFWAALSALMAAESRARARFAGGDESGAAEAILASAREHVTVLNSRLRAFREAELEGYQTTRGATVWRSRALLGATGALWAFGLVAFALAPWRRPMAEMAATQPAVEAFAEPAVTPGVTAPSIDLAAAAALAVDLSCLSDQEALPGLLARGADLLGARGVVIWMGAGGELFAAAAHGYDDAVLARIKPIPRQADNATAAAWRTGELRRVPADASGYGAIVAPLLSPAGCVGVLAAEVGSQRERDDATHAVALILASQLASVLAAWPAASTTASVERPLDRKAAAS
jgi:hypothetical protein